MEISSFYTCVPKTRIIWGTIPEIQSKTIFCHFGPLTVPLPHHPNKPENQNFEQMKKASGDVNKKQSWCMLTQIWHATDIIFCRFRPFLALLLNYWPQKLNFEKKNVKNTRRYYPFTHVYHKSRSYGVWFLRYKVQRTEFFVILVHFLNFDPPNNPKNQNFEKNKKNPEDNIILCFCIINDNHMMYGSWDIEHDRIFSHFGPLFALYPLPPSSNNPENQIWYMVPEIWSSTDRIFLSSWAIFSPFPPKSPKNENIKKMKKHLEISDGCNYYFSFWAVVFPFTPLPPPLNSPENENFTQIRKMSGDIIILRMFTKNCD